jgi:hypothetical protein
MPLNKGTRLLSMYTKTRIVERSYSILCSALKKYKVSLKNKYLNIKKSN